MTVRPEIRVIGIAGGSGSGKTTYAIALRDRLGHDRCSILHQDAYYHDLGGELATRSGPVNFDHPDAIDFDLLVQHLRMLRAGEPVETPVYDYVTHRRQSQTHTVLPRSCIVLEGILVLAHASIRELLDTKVFIEAPEALRLARRHTRDAHERGRDAASVEQQFLTQVKPMHDKFVEPSRYYADQVYSGVGAVDDQIRSLLRAHSAPSEPFAE